MHISFVHAQMMVLMVGSDLHYKLNNYVTTLYVILLGLLQRTQA